MLEAITFDYDGTIGMTFERQFNWFKHWAKANNKPFPFENMREFQGFYNSSCAEAGGVQNVYDKLSLPCSMKDYKHPVWAAYENFKKENPAIIYPGIKEAIEEIWVLSHLSENPLRNKRIRISINTTSRWSSVYPDLKSAGLIPFFDSRIDEETLRMYQGDGNSHGILKPSTIPLALNLDLLGSSGENTLHIGDTVNDLAASYKVMRLNPIKPETIITVGAAWGYEGRKVLENGRALKDGTTIHFNYIIDHPKELVRIVKENMSK